MQLKLSIITLYTVYISHLFFHFFDGFCCLSCVCVFGFFFFFSSHSSFSLWQCTGMVMLIWFSLSQCIKTCTQVIFVSYTHILICLFVCLIAQITCSFNFTCVWVHACVCVRARSHIKLCTRVFNNYKII